MSWDPQLTVNKGGDIKIGAAPFCVDDLDPLTSVKVATVHYLQFNFWNHTIWLVGELIHVIRDDGYETRAHWSETPRLESYCTMNVTNLLQLADHLETVSPPRFHMGNFSLDEHREGVPVHAHECGTVACAAGHGPAAGLPVEASDEDWHAYTTRVFNLTDDAWVWCFSGTWARRDNSPQGAAKRIRHLVYQGLPADANEQRWGNAPYLFAEAEPA